MEGSGRRGVGSRDEEEGKWAEREECAVDEGEVEQGKGSEGKRDKSRDEGKGGEERDGQREVG